MKNNKYITLLITITALAHLGWMIIDLIEKVGGL